LTKCQHSFINSHQYKAEGPT